MNMRVWLIDSTGSPKLVPVTMINEKESEGWAKLDSREIRADGNPKQTYYPQYDKQNPISRVRVDSDDINREILDTEVF